MTSYLITRAFQNLAFSSCVDISCHADDYDDYDSGSDGGSNCGDDDDDDVMSIEAQRRYTLKFTYITNYGTGLPLKQNIENLRKGK